MPIQPSRHWRCSFETYLMSTTQLRRRFYRILLPRFTRAVALAFPDLSHRDQGTGRNDVLAEWWTSNRSQMSIANDVLAEWAWRTIRRNPIRYASNCILNYWALWRD